VLHQIGAGTLGPVFRAYDAERERLVAVKLFRLDLPPERVHQLVDAFERLIAAELNHPSHRAAHTPGKTRPRANNPDG
jgi:serine/threonine protein kinase